MDSALKGIEPALNPVLVELEKKTGPNHFYRIMAHRPEAMQAFMAFYKSVMGPGVLERRLKEMIYLAVSMSNQCDYCVASHTAGARSKGMTDEQLKELIAVMGFANANNRIAAGYQVEIDEQFKR